MERMGEGVSTLLVGSSSHSVNEGDMGSGWRKGVEGSALGRAGWDGVAMGTAACQEPCLQRRSGVLQVPGGGGWCVQGAGLI